MKRSYVYVSALILVTLSRVAFGEGKLIGQWNFFLPSPDGVKLVLAEFSEDQGRYAGSFTGEQGTVELLNVQSEGESFYFEHEVEKLFVTMTLEFNGRVEGDDSISGEIDTPMGLKMFKGVRKK